MAQMFQQRPVRVQLMSKVVTWKLRDTAAGAVIEVCFWILKCEVLMENGETRRCRDQRASADLLGPMEVGGVHGLVLRTSHRHPATSELFACSTRRGEVRWVEKFWAEACTRAMLTFFHHNSEFRQLSRDDLPKVPVGACTRTRTVLQKYRVTYGRQDDYLYP
jgi:hypothetical protein